MEKNFQRVLQEQHLKMEEEFGNKEFQEKLLHEKHLQAIREKIRRDCEEEEKVERKRLKDESKQRIEDIKVEMEQVEQELQSIDSVNSLVTIPRHDGRS